MTSATSAADIDTAAVDLVSRSTRSVRRFSTESRLIVVKKDEEAFRFGTQGDAVPQLSNDRYLWKSLGEAA
jgi:hypothetical protein